MSLVLRTAHVSLALAMLALASAPALAEAQDGADGGITVTEIVTSRAYTAADGATDPTTTFASSDGRLYVMVRVQNTTGAEADIRVSFERADGTAADGAGTGGVVLHIPASRRYRTVARTSTSRPAGRYRAVVRTSEGTVIGQVEFEITE
jgi:hypothetical protein